MTLINVAIIGTAGRYTDIEVLDRNKYDKIVDYLHNYLSQFDTSNIRLVSGGSAFMDHLAVKLFLKGCYNSLYLFLPAYFDVSRERFTETQTGKYNCGRRLNELHLKYYRQTGYNPFKELSTAFQMGALIDLSTEFDIRNERLACYANSNITTTYAFTFSTTNEPNDGGTRNTYNMINYNKYHLGIQTII